MQASKKKNSRKSLSDNTILSSNAKIRQDLIYKIQKYQDTPRFQSIVRKELKITYTLIQLQKLNVSTLENIIERIRKHLDMRNMDKFWENMVQTVSLGAEKIISPYYDITGFHHNITANEDFWFCLERYKIEKKYNFNLPPELQIAYILFGTAIMTHSMNAYKKLQTRNIQKKEKEKDVTKKEKKKEKDITKKEENIDTYIIGQSI